MAHGMRTGLFQPTKYRRVNTRATSRGNGVADELLRTTAGHAGEGVAEMRAKVQASLASAREGLAQAQEAALAHARAAGRAADDYVHENPWRSIGLAAACGLVVGMLIGRR